MKTTTCAILAGTVAFCAIACLLNVLAGINPLSWQMVFSGLTLGVIITGFGALASRAFGRDPSHSLCYAASCALVAGILFFLMSLQEFNNGALLGSLVAGSFGFLSGLAGSRAARIANLRRRN